MKLHTIKRTVGESALVFTVFGGPPAAVLLALLVIGAAAVSVPFKLSLLLNVALACAVVVQRFIHSDRSSKLRAAQVAARHWKKSAARKEDYIHRLSEHLDAANAGIRTLSGKLEEVRRMEGDHA